jgi:uncharacterized membrane protein (UPF0127 family)
MKKIYIIFIIFYVSFLIYGDTKLIPLESIPDNYGMLFVFDEEDIRSFWMKNTFIYLDIICLDKNKQIVDMFTNVPPCKTEPCKNYISSKPAKYVLELKGNRVKDLNLKKDDFVFFILDN